MKNAFVKAILWSFLFIVSMNIVYANQIANPGTKTYILKITAKDPNKVIKFKGSLLGVDKDSVLYDISNVTPSEVSIKAKLLSTIIQIPYNESEIKVVLVEKNNKGEEAILSGIGHVIVTHSGWGSKSTIFAY